MSHVALMIESSHLLCVWCVMSHIWLSHVALVTESCRTCELVKSIFVSSWWVMSHLWLSHLVSGACVMRRVAHRLQHTATHYNTTHYNTLQHNTIQSLVRLWCVMSHVCHVPLTTERFRRAPRINESCCTNHSENESCHTYEWVISHSCMKDSGMYNAWVALQHTHCCSIQDLWSESPFRLCSSLSNDHLE